MEPAAQRDVVVKKDGLASRKRQLRDEREPITVTTLDRHGNIEKVETFDPPSYEWKRAVERAIGSAERALDQSESFLKWLLARIENWKLRPLYDELKAQREAKRNGRR